MNPFKAIGNVIVHPKRTVAQAKEKTMQALIVNLLMKAIRHGLTAYGGAELLSGDQGQQLAGALTFLVGFGWSVAQAVMDHRAKQVTQ